MSKLAKALAAAAGNAGGTESDPNFNQVSLLLNGDGTDGGQNNTYTDSSTNSFTITKNGDVTQGSVSPFGDNWSVYVSGVDTQGFTTSTSSWGDFGTGDFSIEAWVYPESYDSVGGFRVFDTRASAAVAPWMFGVRNSSNPFIDFMYGSNARITGSIAISLSTWTHIAVTRESGTVRLFVNGVLDTSATITSSINCGTSTPRILKIIDSGTSPEGYASNIRVVKGTAIYTSAFTPSAEPLTAISGTSLLICQSNYFVDNSPNDYTLTVSGSTEVTSFSPFVRSEAITLAANGGSAYFDGSSYLTFPTVGVSAFLVNGDFTVEAWIYPVSGRTFIFATCGNNSGHSGFNFTSNSSYYLQLFSYVNNAVVAAGTTPVPFNQWSHVAATRSGSTVRLFLNGNLEATATNTQSFNPTSNGGIGAPSTNRSFYSNGYSSNVRLVKGIALYTSAFTPPTAPLTAINNTSLLLNFEDAAIFDYAAINNVNTAGNADISTAVVKYGTGSLEFSGGSDFLELTGEEALDLASSDFTIELWVNFKSFVDDSKFYIDITNTSNYWQFRYSTSLGICLTIQGFSHIVQQGNTSGWSTGTWYHVALVKEGSTFTIYRDGVSIATGTGTIGNYSGKYIGGWPSDGSMNAYFDDFRITKGLARYTANFTPPTAELPTF